jgi:RNA polymerase sigma-70 factor (ECF subfamily)
MQIAAMTADLLKDLDDQALVERARNRDGVAIRLIMQRHNRRLFRVARSVLHDDAEAEDVVQEAYVRAFTHLDGFRGDAQLSTWLTRIALNVALGRLRQRRVTVELGNIDNQGENRVIYLPTALRDSDPEAAATRAEVRHLLERAVDQLPDAFRVVFVLRQIEEMSTEETASQLGVLPQTVKTRLHRARQLLRRSLAKTLSNTAGEIFPCAGPRCARITDKALERLGIPEPSTE